MLENILISENNVLCDYYLNCNSSKFAMRIKAHMMLTHAKYSANCYLGLAFHCTAATTFVQRGSLFSSGTLIFILIFRGGVA